MKKWLITASVLLPLALLGWLLHDDAPDAQAQAWLEAFEARRSQPSPSYLSLLGLDAPPAQAPQQLGQARLLAYVEWLDAGEPEDGPADTPGALPAPPREQLCDAGEAQCLARLASGRLDGARLLAEHATLVERYRGWRDGPAPRQQALPGPAEPLPQYSLLVQGNHLLALQAVGLIEQGNPPAARELLLQDIAGLRRQLADSDTLIGKMLVLRMLANDVQRLALWQGRGLLPALPPLAPLSEAERSLRLPMQHEFAGAARLLRGLRESSADDYGDAPLWLLYKPQRSINRAWPHYARIAELSELTSAQLARRLAERPAQENPSPWQEPRNPIGQILLNLSGPALERYVLRTHDLDARIRLLNLAQQLPEEPAQIAAALQRLPAAGSPYQPERPARWDAGRQRLCFDGPSLGDDDSLRCLQLR